jgi:hypothetical protein
VVKTNKAVLSSIIEKSAEHNGVLQNRSAWIFDAKPCKYVSICFQNGILIGFGNFGFNRERLQNSFQNRITKSDIAVARLICILSFRFSY